MSNGIDEMTSKRIEEDNKDKQLIFEYFEKIRKRGITDTEELAWKIMFYENKTDEKANEKTTNKNKQIDEKKREKRRKKKQRHLALKRKKKELELKRKYDKQKAANRRKKLKAKQKAYKRKKEQQQLEKQQIEEQTSNNSIDKLDQLYEQILLERQKQIQTQQIKANNSPNKQSKNNISNISKKKRKLPRKKKKKCKAVLAAPPGLTNKKPYQAQTDDITVTNSTNLTVSNDEKVVGNLERISERISDECVLNSKANTLKKRGVNDRGVDKLTFDTLYDYVSDYDCGNNDLKYDYSDSENEIDTVLKNIVFGDGTDCGNKGSNDINCNGNDEFIYHLPHGIVSVPNVQQYDNDCVSLML